MPLDALDTLNSSSTLSETLKKAKFEILDSNEKKADEIEVLFNPSQYVLSEAAKYNPKSVPASDAPQITFGGGRAATLNMELFLDTSMMLPASIMTSSSASDVSVKVKKLEELIYIKGNAHAPPIVKFVWGSLSFKGVVTDLKSTFTQFTESGMPIQAKVSISLMAYFKANDRKRKSPFESPDRTKCRMIREDYSIWDIAQSEYGDVSKWKVIARANNISNPLEVPPGTIVTVPAL